MKITIKIQSVGGKLKWVVSWKPKGKRRRWQSFNTPWEAEEKKRSLEEQSEKSKVDWKAIDESQRVEIGLLIKRATDKGYTLKQACDYMESAGIRDVTTSLGAAVERFIAEKRQLHLSIKTIQAFKSTLGRFTKGRKKRPLHLLGREDVIKWLKPGKWKPRTYNSYLTTLVTFFKWSTKVGLISKNPMDSISKIGKKQMPDIDTPPTILHFEQCRRLLQAALEIDRGLISYITLGIFAGLRPMKEAGKFKKEDIDGDTLLVRGANAKDRQRRYVTILPVLKAWLDIPGVEFCPKNLRRRFEYVRARAGLIKRTKVPGKARKHIETTGWDQDCLRHTFASHFLPIYGVEKTIEQMGHRDSSMLFGNYRNLVTKSEAEKFWTELTPANIIASLFDFENITADLK